MMKIKLNNKGYVAISSVLVIGTMVLAIGLAVTLNGINEAQSSMALKSSETSLAMVNSCASDALMRLNLTGSIPATINLPQGSCTVTINSSAGNNWDFTVSGSLNGYEKTVQIVANRGSLVTITSWLEK